MSYLYGLVQNPYFLKQCIVDAIYVCFSDWINTAPEDNKLKTSNIYAKVSWPVKY